MIDWPENLIRDIARKRAVLFLGAGVSKNSVGENGKRPPDWKEFLEKGIDWCGSPKQHLQSLMKNGDYLTACEIIKTRLRDRFTDLLYEEFRDPRYQTADIHKHLFNLDVRLVLTQNFDKIYDTYAQSESQGTVAVKNYDDSDVASIIRDGRPTVVKVHGTIDKPTEMIFTRREYSEARHKHAAFYAMLDALVLTHTFLFIGCGLSDPDMRMLLERQTHFYSVARPHFIVMPKTRKLHLEIQNSLEENMSLRVLSYAPSNHHEKLTQSLEELANQVEQRRVELAQTQDW